MGSKTEEDLLDYKKSIKDGLSKGSNSAVMSELKQLAKIPITEQLLRKTDMGVFVAKLKTHEDKDISQLAKSIIKDWKTQVQPNTTTNATSTSATSSASNSRRSSENGTSTAATTASKSSPSATSTNSSRPKLDVDKHRQPSHSESSRSDSPKTPTSATSSEAPKDRTVRSDGVRIPPTGDGVRDKCIEMLYSALGVSSFAESDRLLDRSVKIEAIIFADLSPGGGAPSASYKAKIRSLFLNLKDKNNPSLRESVVEGSISPQKFSKMTSEEMKSEEAQARDRKIAEENMFKAKGALEQQAETDMFKCGKCKGRKCTYYQMQTRSADEPMTTFVTCRDCGNRWKFC